MVIVTSKEHYVRCQPSTELVSNLQHYTGSNISMLVDPIGYVQVRHSVDSEGLRAPHKLYGDPTRSGPIPLGNAMNSQNSIDMAVILGRPDRLSAECLAKCLPLFGTTASLDLDIFNSIGSIVDHPVHLMGLSVLLVNPYK